MPLTDQTKKHLSFFLVAISFILVQVIIEMVFVYFFTLFFENVIMLFYEQKWILIVMHFIITAILIILARPFAEKFYKPKMV